MSAGPGVELLLDLVRDAARGRRCAACGRTLADATAEPREVDPERVAVALVCTCGVTEIVEVRPSGEGGRAEII